MQTFNAKLSEHLALVERLVPVSQAAATVTTGWVSMKDTKRLLALISCGVLGASATVDAKLQQATDTSGTGAKDISGKAITQLVKASNDNNEAIINLADDELDIANGFNAVRLSLTVGTAASLIAAQLWAGTSFEPASDLNKATVVQVV
jgi:hypothetical protein